MGRHARWCAWAWLGLSACGAPAPDHTAPSQAEHRVAGAVVARVGGQPIGLGEVEALSAAARLTPREALEQLVEERLLADYAAERGYGDLPAVQLELERARVRALLEVAVEREVRPDNVPVEQVLARFEELRGRLDHPGGRGITHVLFRAGDAADPRPEQLASDLLARAQAAGDLEAVRALLETYAPTGESEGVGFVREAFTVPQGSTRFEAPFVEAVESIAAPGVVPRLARTSYGYHVILVAEIVAPQPARLADHEAKIRDQLALEGRKRRVEALLEELRKTTPIHYDEPLIEKAFAADPAAGAGS